MENFDDSYLDPELMVDTEIKTKRLKTCLECASYTPPTCNKCNCVVGMMVSYTFKSCPIGKW
jgi:hypothetical protein